MGPLALIDTITAGINLDVSRLLYMGNDKILEFIVPDSSVVGNWRVVLTLIQGFNRITDEERTSKDGSEVILKVADPDEVLRPVLGLDDLHVRLETIIYKVSKTPPVASNEAQVYDLTCKIRTLRSQFDNTK